MSSTNTGGPAFPIHPQFPATVGCINSKSDAGMTLRDYFAAKVLQAYLADPAFSNVTQGTIARLAYDMADAMLKARDGQP